MPSPLWRHAERALESARALERGFNEGPGSPLFPSAQDVITAIRHAEEFKARIDAVDYTPETGLHPGPALNVNAFWANTMQEAARKARNEHNEALLAAYVAHREMTEIVWRVAGEYARVSASQPLEAA